MRLRIDNMESVMSALANGEHPNRIVLLLSSPVLPPMPLGQNLDLIDGIVLPLDVPSGFYCA